MVRLGRYVNTMTGWSWWVAAVVDDGEVVMGGNNNRGEVRIFFKISLKNIFSEIWIQGFLIWLNTLTSTSRAQVY